MAESAAIIGDVANHHRAGADEDVAANRDPRNADGASAKHGSFADRHSSSQADARAEVSVRGDFAVVIDAATGVSDAIFADLGVGVHDNSTKNDGSGADSS